MLRNNLKKLVLKFLLLKQICGKCSFLVVFSQENSVVRYTCTQFSQIKFFQSSLLMICDCSSFNC